MKRRLKVATTTGRASIPLSFYEEWYSGPQRMCRDLVREMGFKRGPLRGGRYSFIREFGDWNGFKNMLEYFAEYFREINVLLSIACYQGSVNEPGNPIYPALHYDFDDNEDPRRAVRSALEFARSVKKRYGADPVVVFSGIRGAHVVVPLKMFIDWDTYVIIYKILVSPHRFAKKLMDEHMLQKNRLDRVPYTYNYKEKGKRGFSYIIDINGKRVSAEEFSWENYEPLDPRQMEIVKIKPAIQIIELKRVRAYKYRGNKDPLPKNVEELVNNNAVPPCIRNIIKTMIDSGDPDHYARIALVLWLKWTGYPVETVIDFFRKYAKDYKEQVTRYQVEYLYGKRGSRKVWLMYSCRKMQEYGLCLRCGWNGNPITYTYTRAIVKADVRERFRSVVIKDRVLRK